jgi:hypothetical protein
MWTVNFVAVGLSTARKPTFLSISVAMKVTLRLNLSSSAMIGRARCFLQAAMAFSSSGRSLRLPLSTSVNSAISFSDHR